MDSLDEATIAEERDRERAISRARAALDQGGPEWIDGKPCCRECGNVIPEGRIRAVPNAAYCISCQEEKERNGEFAREREEFQLPTEGEG